MINIFQTEDTELITQSITECDSSFSKHILERDDCSEFINKLIKNATFVIAFDSTNSKLVGYSATYMNDVVNCVAYISLICVIPEMQGKHIGVRLLDKICELAKKKGMHSIRLSVDYNNNKALSVYQKYGFSFEETNHKSGYYMYMNL